MSAEEEEDDDGGFTVETLLLLVVSTLGAVRIPNSVVERVADALAAGAEATLYSKRDDRGDEPYWEVKAVWRNGKSEYDA